MILNDTEVQSRLNSVNNLSNRLKSLNVKTIVPEIFDVNSIPADMNVKEIFKPEVKGEDHLAINHQTRIAIPIDVADNRIPAGIGNDDMSSFVESLQRKAETLSANGKAVTVLHETLDLLRERLCEAENPIALSRIANDMGKIINNTKEEQKSSSSGNNVIIYKPVMVNESHYQQIAVHE